MRIICNLFIRLSIIHEGELLQVPLEAALPRPIRLTFPGAEDPSNRVRMVMDASGTGYFVLDLSTGRYLWEEFTEAENFWFNKFESGADATIINKVQWLTHSNHNAAPTSPN